MAIAKPSHQEPQDGMDEPKYPVQANPSIRETKRVVTVEMFMRALGHFPNQKEQLVLILNAFKYMAFLSMHESWRGDYKREQAELLHTPANRETVENYQFCDNFDTENPDESIDNMRQTPPRANMPSFGAPSHGTVQARNNLQDSYIATAMKVCGPAYNMNKVVLTALQVFHDHLAVGSLADISERKKAFYEQSI